MEPEKLKQEYGDRLTFWGGGVDTQSIFLIGKPDEIKAQVKERLSVLGKGGGYVFAPTQNIQADIPIENIEAMLAAISEYNLG